MFVQTENTPNPNALKFIPEKKVSNLSSYEISDKSNINSLFLFIIKSFNNSKDFPVFSNGVPKYLACFDSKSRLCQLYLFSVRAQVIAWALLFFA